MKANAAPSEKPNTFAVKMFKRAVNNP